MDDNTFVETILYLEYPEYLEYSKYMEYIELYRKVLS